MRRSFAPRLGLFLLGFLIFAGFRLTYGYIMFPNGEPITRAQSFASAPIDFEISRRNYAGQKKGLSAAAALPQAMDQRYEKIANIGLVSESFDADEAEIRSAARDAGALVQYEQAFGLTGARRLQLALGVPPEAFDDVIAELRQIGRQVSFQVNKTDKTNEYRSLLARQQSLQTSRESLIALQVRDAELDDLIALERSILDLNQQIQDLGVAVGEFDSEFEFVTIKIALTEVAPTQLRDIAVMSRLKTALEWAVSWYLGLSVALLLLSGASFLGIRAYAALKPAKTG